ncbi:MAG TPA: PQQ-dependent dehydrogenase, methanol/ethanol family [Blastocatellia bacterium]|nr:PQQ-dependent dehydrogenase, methanol/ethanol family [Blastocatellia bacterium]
MMQQRPGRRLILTFIFVTFMCAAWLMAPGMKTEAVSQAPDQAALIAAGNKLFNPTCGTGYCHGANGAGGSGPSLRDRSYTNEQLLRIISEGVPGTAMPAFKTQFSPEQIRQLVAYVMSISKGGATTTTGAASPEAAARAARRFGPDDQATTGLQMPPMKEVTGERLVNAAKEPQNWMTYFGTYNAQRYSTLSQINRDNVKNIAPAWAFQTGKIEGGLNAAPLVVDGVMYLVGSYNRVFALDAVTGKLFWHYFYKVPSGPIPYGVSVRGLAVGYGLVFMGTLDNHLVALDARTGKEVWNVEIEDYRKCGCNISAAPILVKDKVVVGVTGGDSAHRGYLNAYFAKSGQHAWRFYTIPGPGEPGFETWEAESWKYGGGATWMVGSYDPELNLIYWGVGNPSSDFHGGDREGDNLYTGCVVALDADTGKLKWHYQEVPHDVYDFDAAYEPTLIDLERNGQKQKLLVHTNKGGYVWVLDRVTGKYINAWPHVDTINWVKGFDRNGKHIGRLEVPTGKSTLVCPFWGGGRSLNHQAYSPRTGWLYNHGIEWCGLITPIPQEPKEGRGFVAGTIIPQPPPNGQAYGHIDAFDPVTGAKKWTVKMKYPLTSSLLATAGDLLLTADVEGNFLAFDAKTGEQLYSFNTGSGTRGSPITYSVNGRQYIAVPSGLGSIFTSGLGTIWPEARNFQNGSTLFVFALPESAIERRQRTAKR